MPIYILKFSGCLFILMLFYKLFLEKESFHVIKRFYLLGALLFSISIPFITFIEYVEVSNVVSPQLEVSAINNSDSSLQNNVVETSWKGAISTVLWSIYTIGFIVFSFRFGKHLYEMYFRIKNNVKIKDKTFTNVLLLEYINPHTFFNYIFFNKYKYETNAIPKEIVLHEQTHARELHALDIIFIEILQIIFWFNPLIYLIKKDIKLNHEFLADQSVLKVGIETINYQQLLLAFSSNASEPKLANAINYSSIKKRLTVMKIQTSKSKKRIKGLLLMPLLAILVYGFSSRALVEKEMEPQISIENPLSLKNEKKASPKELAKYNRLAKFYNKQPETTRVIPSKNLLQLERMYRKMSERQKTKAEPFPNCSPNSDQKGALKEQMLKYNNLATYYNTMFDEDKNIRIKLKDVESLKYIYSIMSDEQRKTSEPFPDFPKPPPPPPSPNHPELVEIGEAPEIIEIQEIIIKEQKSSLQKQETIEEVVEQKDESLKTGTREVNGQILYYTSQKGKTTYYNREGQKVDRKGNIINSDQTHAEDIIEGHVISKVYKDDRVIVEFNTENISIPPPPPPAPPKIPSIRTLSKRGAVFYYEGKEISSEKAIKLTDNDKDLNLLIRNIDTKKPIVQISKQPISTKKN